MIPPDELKRLRDCVARAWRLAGQGQAAEGYLELDLGLTWAETPALYPAAGQADSPEPWAAELATRYRRELARYSTEYAPCLGMIGLVRRTQFTREAAAEIRAASRSLRERSGELRQRAWELAEVADTLRLQANQGGSRRAAAGGACPPGSREGGRYMTLEPAHRRGPETK